MRFTPGGANIISGSFDADIKIWNTSTGALIRTLQGHTEAVVGLAISPDGNTIASGSDDYHQALGFQNRKAFAYNGRRGRACVFRCI